MIQPTLLCYNLSPLHWNAVRSLAVRMRLRAVPILPAQQFQTLAEVLSGAKAPALSPMAQPFSDELLVMAYFPEPLLDALLPALRASGAAIALKAALTPTNAGWTGKKLRDELAQEHAMLHR